MKFEFSAGGVVFKKEVHVITILLCQHAKHHGWVFPKGFIGDRIMGESKEETALREVEEETGVKGKILTPLSPISYGYEMDGIKRKKTVYYYIMKYIAGDISQHDREMENVTWLPMSLVDDRLTYKSDKNVWAHAKSIIASLA